MVGSQPSDTSLLILTSRLTLLGVGVEAGESFSIKYAASLWKITRLISAAGALGALTQS